MGAPCITAEDYELANTVCGLCDSMIGWADGCNPADVMDTVHGIVHATCVCADCHRPGPEQLIDDPEQSGVSICADGCPALEDDDGEPASASSPVDRGRVADAVELLDRALTAAPTLDRGVVCDAALMLHRALHGGPWCVICGGPATETMHGRHYCLDDWPAADLMGEPC